MKNLFDFKSFFQFLSRNKTYTFIDVFGLSISLMFVILIGVYTMQELSVDQFQEKGDRICVFANESHCGSAYRLGQKIKDRYPEVEEVCPVAIFTNHAVTVGEQRFKSDVLLVGSVFFDMFSFKLLDGDRKEALSDRSKAVISESYARKVFGGADPMGKSIRVTDSTSVIVSGVMADIKNSSIPYGDILVPMDNVKYFNPSMDSEEMNNYGSTCLLFQLTDAHALDAKEADMLEWLKTFVWTYQRGLERAYMIPLDQFYFNDLPYVMVMNHGDWQFVIVLMSIGLVILLFAIINYINLTVAQTGFRAKEMAMRSLLGSQRGELFSRLMMESTLMAFLSFVIGLLLAYAAVPFANDLLETKVDLTGAISIESVTAVLLMILVLGGLSGLLPALIISRTKAIEVVRGSFRMKTKMVFSRFFITFQNAITITLIAVSITMAAQCYHMIHAPLGYNTHQIIEFSLPDENASHTATLSNELERLSCVKRVGLSWGSPFLMGNNWSAEYNGRNLSIQMIRGNQAYFDMMGFQVIRDNGMVNDKETWYLNEEGFHLFGFTADTLAFHLGETNFKIAGTLKDFQLRNITNEFQRPVLVQILKQEEMLEEAWYADIEVTGDPYTAMNEVKRVYEKLTGLEFTGKYIDQKIADSYAGQVRLTKIVVLFAGIAILISLLGLIAMSTYFIQQRILEVAVRKVFGSTSREIWVKLVRTFLSYVLIAFVLAVPVIWYFMHRWLLDYSYRIELHPVIFLAAGLFCFLISFATVFFQSWRAANTDPVESFRNRQC